MVVDFTRDLQDPSNKINERAGKPVVDNSGLFKNIEQAGAAIGDVFAGVKENQDQQVRSATTQALYSSIDPVDSTIQNHPQMQSLASTAAAVQQGNQSPMALAVKKIAVFKDLNNQYPGKADVIDSQIHRISGTTGYQDFVKETLAPREAAAEQRKQLISSSISSGTVVLGKGGQIDENASIQALIQHNASAEKARAYTQNYEQGLHSQEQYNTNMGSELIKNIHTSADRSFTNALNSPEYQQIKTLPEGQQALAKINFFNHWKSTFEASTNEQVARIGGGEGQGPNQTGSAGTQAPVLTLSTQKAIQDQRDAMMKSYEGIVLDKKNALDVYADLSKQADDAGALNKWQTQPELTQAITNLGPIASAVIGNTNQAFDVSGITNKVNKVLSLGGPAIKGLQINTTGIPNSTTPAKYVAPDETWMKNLQFTNQVTTNPKALPAAVTGGDSSQVVQTVTVARALATQAKDFTPQQDLSYNIAHQNLTGLALSDLLGGSTVNGTSIGSTQDLVNNIKEITQPIHIDALLTSQTKAYNPSANTKSINDTVDTINKGLFVLPQSFSGLIANKQLAIDPNTGYLQVDQETYNKANNSLKPEDSGLGIAVKNVSVYNRAVNAYIKLKDNTPYKGLSDVKIRQILNQKFLPQLMPTDKQSMADGSFQVAANDEGQLIKQAIRDSMDRTEHLKQQEKAHKLKFKNPDGSPAMSNEPASGGA